MARPTAQAQSGQPSPDNFTVVNGPNAGEAILSWDAVSRAQPTIESAGLLMMRLSQALAENSDVFNHYVFADITGCDLLYRDPACNPANKYWFTVASLSERFGESGRAGVLSLTLNADGSSCPTPTPGPGTGTPTPPPPPGTGTGTPTPPPPGTGTPTPTPTQPPSTTVPPVSNGDYDADNDGLIEIRNLVQLNAIRWDLDGNGVAEDNVRAAYAASFPDAAAGMGCPSGACTGYELVTDLDYGTEPSGAGWPPIQGFNATFDGGSHTISNLFIARGGARNVGLFGQTQQNSTIRQVRLTAVNVTGGTFVGPLVGYSRGVVSNSSAYGNVVGENQVGGLVGENHYGTISESYSTSVVSGGIDVGGLAGKDYGGIITDSYATGFVTGSGRYTGGLVGYSYTSTTITNSYATGNVTSNGGAGGLVGYAEHNATITSGHASGDVLGRVFSGGLVGRIGPNGAITASYATGNVEGNMADGGGLVGANHGGIITASYATGNLRNYNNYHNAKAGGLVGYNSGIIIGAYASGDVSGRGRVGGLVGDTVGTITATYSIGRVSFIPPERRSDLAGVGGLIGFWGDGTVNASYWDTEASGLVHSSGGTGLTTSEMQTPTRATGIYTTWNPSWWDFGTSNEYPALKYSGLSVALQRGAAEPSATAPSNTDRAALVALYNATDGANWTNNTGWDTGAPIDQWYSVTTDGDGRVTRLELDTNGLNGRIPATWEAGTIPSELGNLANLEELTLPQNQLTGEIPSELGDLGQPHRTELGLQPVERGDAVRVGRLGKPVVMRLGSNRLSGAIPPALESLSNLSILGMGNNQLNGQIPSQIGNLASLTRFHPEFYLSNRK